MDARAQGESIMVELRGTEYIAQRAAQWNAFNDVLQDYAAEVRFGRVWSRVGLDRKQRSVITVARLVALNRPAQLRNHLEGALNNGCTAAEIRRSCCTRPYIAACLPPATLSVSLNRC